MKSFPWLPVLTVLFIGLKLGGAITWSWFWVLSPMIFSVGLLGIILLLTGFLYYLGYEKFELTQKSTKPVK